MGNRNIYRNYSSQDLENAIMLVNSQTLSIRGASRRYNVPKSTIIDKHYGKSSLHSRSGPKSVLSETDENIIVEWTLVLIIGEYSPKFALPGFVTENEFYPQENTNQ
jgi:hypothetical protein